MKNPLNCLKHLKTPMNSIAEADERKKEVLSLMYCTLGILAIGLILQLAAKLEFMAALSFVGLAGTGFCIFLLAVIHDAKKRFKGLTCNKCNTLAEIKTPEAFAKYISYNIESDQAIFKGYTGSREPTNGVYSQVKVVGTSKAVVAVTLTCPHCGEVKHLQYNAEPFKCHAEAKNVRATEFSTVRTSLELAVRTAVNDYNNPDKKALIPYSLHSTKNPHFEERTTFKGANAPGARPDYMGATISYRKDVAEMLEHYFVIPELNGALTDLSKSKKAK